MPLPYSGSGGVPCYQTVPFERYSPELLRSFWDMVGECQSRGIPEPEEPLHGSYSAVAPCAGRKTAAKLVMYERNRGGWVGGRSPRPLWNP